MGKSISICSTLHLPSAVSQPSSEGIVPTRWFELKSKFSAWHSQMGLAATQKSPFNEDINSLICRRRPNSVGIVPVRLLPFNLNCRPKRRMINAPHFARREDQQGNLRRVVKSDSSSGIVPTNLFMRRSSETTKTSCENQTSQLHLNKHLPSRVSIRSSSGISPLNWLSPRTRYSSDSTRE